MKNRKAKSSSRKWVLIVGVFLMLLFCLVVADLFVVQPQRLERERQARRDAPSQLVRPSLRVEENTPERETVTAFRAEEWRVEPRQDTASVYLGGYMLVMEAEKALGQGDVETAKLKFESAAETFEQIRRLEPDFNPDIVDYRLRMIDSEIARIDAGVVPKGDPFDERLIGIEKVAEVEPAPHKGAVDPADVYLHGYLLFQDAEAKLKAGHAKSAKLKFAEAAKVFSTIQQRMPNYEPEMVAFRARKIDEALVEIDASLKRGSKPQSSIESSGDEMQVARK